MVWQQRGQDAPETDRFLNEVFPHHLAICGVAAFGKDQVHHAQNSIGTLCDILRVR